MAARTRSTVQPVRHVQMLVYSLLMVTDAMYCVVVAV